MDGAVILSVWLCVTCDARPDFGDYYGERFYSSLICSLELELHVLQSLIFVIVSCASFQMKASVDPDSIHDTTTTMNLDYRYF